MLLMFEVKKDAFVCWGSFAPSGIGLLLCEHGGTLELKGHNASVGVGMAPVDPELWRKKLSGQDEWSNPDVDEKLDAVAAAAVALQARANDLLGHFEVDAYYWSPAGQMALGRNSDSLVLLCAGDCDALRRWTKPLKSNLSRFIAQAVTCWPCNGEKVSPEFQSWAQSLVNGTPSDQ
jgi:hypothetical protein